MVMRLEQTNRVCSLGSIVPCGWQSLFASISCRKRYLAVILLIDCYVIAVSTTQKSFLNCSINFAEVGLSIG